MAKKIFAVKQKPICPVTTILDFGLENIIPFFSVCVEQEDFLTIQSNRYIMPTGSHSVALK
jgi:hypothetical protein